LIYEQKNNRILLSVIIDNNITVNIQVMSKPPIKINIGHKLAAIILLSLSGMTLTLFLFYRGLESSLMQEKKIQSQRLSDAGIGIIKHFYNLASKNIISKAKAKKMAFNTLESATYGTDGYFWINNGKGIMLMQPYTPELVGSNLIESSDVKGNFLFKKFISTAKQGGGWVEYYWPKPKNKKEFQKISYVAYFKPWDLILGTGLYLDNMHRDIKLNALRALAVVFTVTVILALFSISMTRKFLKQLKGLAIRDPLTSLFTRRLLNETIDSLLLKHDREENCLSLIFMDIDHFKKINDTYGHPMGDQVLASVGEMIKKHTRPNDFCYRYGGEEFLVIMFSNDNNSAVVLAERIRKTIKETVFRYKGIKFSITISAGISSRNKAESIEPALARADQNLYKAKEQGRNRVIF